MNSQNKKALKLGVVAIAIIMCVGAGVTGYGYHLKVQDEKDAAQQAADAASAAAKAPTSSEPVIYDLEKFEGMSGNQKPASSRPATTIDTTTDANGNVTMQDNYPKEEKPSAPKLPEGTDITNPDKKPEYTPEEVKPENNKPQKPSEPAGGTIKDGMIYMPGMGWLPDEGVGGTHEVADFELSGELVGY
ncbi:MAG: DUF6550 family protein [Oscillospiraceae bacterium]